MSLRRLEVARACLATVMLLGFTASAAPAADDIFSTLRVSGSETGGTAAVKALGGNLEAVANSYGKTGAELRQMLLRDRTLRVAPNGRLFYKESAPKLPRKAPPSDAINSGLLYPLNQTFSLNSRPDAPRSIVLRFRGATITGTYWNTSFGRPSIVATALDFDNVPGTFNEAELTAIQRIWQRVAEDYAPFDVNVTTDDKTVRPPNSFASVVITKQRMFSTTSPGMAFTSTFGNPTYDPAFVAFDTLGKNDKFISEAVSHEVGHRLGLDHDGKGGSSYYAGQGSGSMRWAPIMGNSYSAPVSQFSKGEYSGANNRQDDFAVMSRFLSYRTDDAGSTAASAAVFPTTSAKGTSSGSLDGVLERMEDQDYFALTAGAGAFSASLNPAGLSPNVDLELSLIDESGAVVAKANPSTALGASINISLAAGGTYFLKVNSAGYGNAATNGFSNYGSRGNYRLTAKYPASTVTAPRAVITASATSGPAPLTVTLSAAASAGITAYAWNFGNGYTSNERTASARFDRPGRYTVELKVTGTPRHSSVTALDIEVNKIFTASVSLTRSVRPDGMVNVTASTGGFVSDGRTFLPDKIYGSWSGAVRADAVGTSRTKSGKNFTSPATTGTACVTFTITKLEHTGTSAAGEQAPKQETYLPAAPITATSCPPQQASR